MEKLSMDNNQHQQAPSYALQPRDQSHEYIEAILGNIALAAQLYKLYNNEEPSDDWYNKYCTSYSFNERSEFFHKTDTSRIRVGENFLVNRLNF